MKKKIFTMLIAALTLVGLTACGSGDTNSSGGGDGKESVTLRWLQFQVEYADQVKQMAKAYEEEHPNVKIEVEVIGDDYYDILKTKASSGDMPDVFMTAGYNEIKTYEEYITDLSDQPFVENIVDGATDAIKLDDKVVGLPVQMSGNGIVYNKAIFEDNNIEIPTTVSELEEVCKTLKAKGITPFTNQFKDDWLLAQLFNYGFVNVEDPIAFIKELDAGSAKIADTPAMQDLIKVVDLMTEYGQENPLDAGWNEAAAMFSQGKQAMMFEGIWAYDTIAQITPDMEIGLFALPLTDNAEDTKLAADVNGVWHISETSKHQDVAADVLNWIVTSDAGKKFLLEECQVIPAMKGMEFEGSNPLSKDVNAYIEDNNTGPWSWPLWPDGFYNGSGKDLQEYISGGNKDAAKVLETLDTQWTKQVNSK